MENSNSLHIASDVAATPGKPATVKVNGVSYDPQRVIDAIQTAKAVRATATYEEDVAALDASSTAG